MALQISTTDTEFKFTFSESYVRVVALTRNFIDNTVIAHTQVFTNKDSRDNDGKVLGTPSFNIEVPTIDESGDQRAAIYNKLKLLEEFNGAIDV